MKKFATFEVLSKVLIPKDASPQQMQRMAHRVNFDYEVRPGFLYIRSRAISSRCNDNFDEFPAEEIEKSYRTFIGKPVFVNHHNENHRRARGVIIDAALHRDRNPDGTPDTWCEVLMEVDAVRFPKLAKAVLAGEIDRTSMGTDVAYSICSACGNKASSPAEYCQHIPRMKGQRIYRAVGSTGRKEGVLIREICYGLGFFENSLLVEEPADPTAFFLGVDDRGVTKAASKEYPRFDGVSLDQDDQGYFVKTHRARSDSYQSPEDIPDKDVEFIRSTGAKTAESIPLDRDDQEFYRQMAEHADQAREMHQHAERRPVDLSDEADLKSHLLESHGWTHGDFWRNSHEEDHPALMGASADDRPLTHQEMRDLHDHEHQEFHHDWPNAVTLGDSHFHTAHRLEMGTESSLGDGSDRPFGEEYPFGSKELARQVDQHYENRQYHDKQVVNLSNHQDLVKHLFNSHGWEYHDLSRNSHEPDHPVLPPSQADDRMLSHSEIRAMHDYEHTSPDWNHEWPHAVTMGDSHFHTASKTASWISDHPDEPTLSWRAPKSGWEVHIDNHMPDRDLRENYGAKPSQGVILYHSDHLAPAHPDSPVGTAPRGGWRSSRDPNTGEHRYTPNAWGASPPHIPAHVRKQVDRAHDEVDKHAQDHADLYGRLAEQQDIRDDLRRVPGDMAAEERAHNMFRNLMNKARGDDDHTAAVHQAAPSSDRWVTCDQGHQHWGSEGAAGLLMRHTAEDGTKRYFLQKRAPWVDHGGTYSVPGGAMHPGEQPHEAAYREAKEEMGNLPPLSHSHTVSDDHGGWGYHTVVADVNEQHTPVGDDEYEHHGGGWYTKDEMASLPLHPGFAATMEHTVEAKGKPVGQMSPEEYEAHKQKRARDKSDGERWNRQNPVRIKHVISHWDQATEGEKATGESWYADAHHLAKHVASDTNTPIHTMAGLLSNYSPQTHWAQNIQTAARVARQKTALGGPGSGVLATHDQRKAADRILGGEHYDSVLAGPKTRAFAHLIEHGGNADPEDPKVVIDRHALSVAAGSRCPDVGYMQSRLGTKSRYHEVSQAYHKAAKQISKAEGRKIEAHQVQATTWLVRQRLNEAHDRALSKTAGSRSATAARTAVAEWNRYAAEHHPSLLGKEPGTGYSTEPDDVQHAHDMEGQDMPINKSSAKIAYGETRAPADVDTLRDEECPVCGESDSFDGNRCQVCGYDAPPAMFRDPDLDKAKQVDLRKDIAEDAGALPGQGGELTPGEQDANGGLPGEIPGEGVAGTDQVVDPEALDENGQPMLDENGNPLDPDADLDAANRHFNQGGEPFTPGPNAPSPQQPMGQGGFEDEEIDPNALDENGQPIEPAREGEPGTPADGVADLVCPSCGYESDAEQPQSLSMDDQAIGADTGDGTLAGDVCPNCGQAQMLSVGEMEQMAQAEPQRV